MTAGAAPIAKVRIAVIASFAWDAFGVEAGMLVERNIMLGVIGTVDIATTTTMMAAIE